MPHKIICFLFFLINGSALSSTLSTWMGQQAASTPGFKEMLITQIAMPGSHNALTYNIGQQKRAQGVLGVAAKIPVIGKSIANISRAQEGDMVDQFNKGSRYFDLRITQTNQGYEGVHGLLNGPIQNGFLALKEHLISHSSEIILLDFQQVTVKDKQSFFNEIKEIFGDLIYPPNQSFPVSYNELINKNQRVIIFSRGGSDISFDRKRYLDSYWYKEKDPEQLKRQIMASTAARVRNINKINVIQSQTTPDVKSVTKSMIKAFVPFIQKDSLEKDAKKSHLHQKEILENSQKTGNERLLNAINVFMTDYVSAEKSQDIIDLNKLKTGR